MKYISTRGQVSPIGFIDAILMGLADDGGLLVPERIPQLSEETLKQWQGLDYPELALEIFSLFVNDEIPRADLKKLVDDSYATFRHEAVTPVHPIHDGLQVLELFHGPTFAFKDVALQFVGNLFEYFLERRNSKEPAGGKTHRLTVVGATSGDTGR